MKNGKLLTILMVLLLCVSCGNKLELETNYYKLDRIYLHGDDTTSLITQNILHPKEQKTAFYIDGNMIIITVNNSYNKVYYYETVEKDGHSYDYLVKNQDVDRIHIYRADEYKILTVENEIYKMSAQPRVDDIDSLIEAFPNYEDILAYEDNYEIKGHVKSVESKEYELKTMFGKDTLVLIGQREYKYNDKGSIIYYNSIKGHTIASYNRKDRVKEASFNYNAQNQLVKVDESTIYESIDVTTYVYNDFGMLEKEKSELGSIAYIYDNNRLVEKNEYDAMGRLDQKTIYHYDVNDHMSAKVYDGIDGAELYMNIYDENNSVVDCLIGSMKTKVNRSLRGTTVTLDSRYSDGMEGKIEYDCNMNIVHEYLKIPANSINGKDKFNIYDNYYSYTLDGKGNWIIRKKISKDNAKTTLTVREIDYYDEL